MKKKIIVLSCILYTASSMFAQIGINTQTPAGLIHIDGQSNTPDYTSGTTPENLELTKDDVIILKNGNIGVGTINPTEKLHVVGKAELKRDVTATSTITNGKTWTPYINTTDNLAHINPIPLEIIGTTKEGIKIESPNIGSDKFLTSIDNNGNAQFNPLRQQLTAVGIDLTTGATTPLYVGSKAISGSTPVNITDQPLTLTKGKWLIIAKYGVKGVGSDGDNVKSLLWTRLESKPTGTSDTRFRTVIVTGNMPEQKTGSWHVIIPQITHIAHITEDTDIRITANIPGGKFQAIALNEDLGLVGFNYFLAIRLDNK